MTRPADECPMVLMEVAVSRHSGTTYEAVAQGLYKAGVMKHATLVSRYDATDEQIEKLRQELLGDLVHLTIEEREGSYEDLARDLKRAEAALAADTSATAWAKVATLMRRTLSLLETIAETKGDNSRIAREVRQEWAENLADEMREIIKGTE